MSQPIAETFGELSLTFIGGDALELAWWDKKSGGKHNGAYYNPDWEGLGQAYDGYYALGSYGQNSYATPVGPLLLVKDVGEGGGKPALRPPDDFEKVWRDKGSGAKQNGSVWRPTSSDPDYVACGLVFVRGGKQEPDPSTARVAMVRKDLTEPGWVGAFVWNSQDTGADKKFGSWDIDCPDEYIDSQKGLIAPGCFLGVQRKKAPEVAPAETNVLKLLLPSEQASEPFRPTLPSSGAPPETSAPDETATVTVPCTAVIDNGLSTAQQIRDTPFYTIEREELWDLAYYDINGNSLTEELSVTEKTGVAKEESETFHINTGVSVKAESGVSFLGTGGKMSATVSIELGFASTTKVSQFRETSVTRTFAIPPESRFAVWTKLDRFTLRRTDRDRTVVSQSLAFRADVWANDWQPLTAEQIARLEAEHARDRQRLLAEKERRAAALASR